MSDEHLLEDLVRAATSLVETEWEGNPPDSLKAADAFLCETFSRAIRHPEEPR